MVRPAALDWRYNNTTETGEGGGGGGSGKEGSLNYGAMRTDLVLSCMLPRGDRNPESRGLLFI